jgi:hypothetical protein
LAPAQGRAQVDALASPLEMVNVNLPKPLADVLSLARVSAAPNCFVIAVEPDARRKLA